MRIKSASTRVGVGLPITTGKTYLVSITMTATTGAQIHVESGASVILVTAGNATVSTTFVAAQTELNIVSSAADADVDCTISKIELYELTDGPIDEYVNIGTQPASGDYDGLTDVYRSLLDTHADGSGGTSDWHIWFDTSIDKYRITPDLAIVSQTARWASATPALIDSYPPAANAVGTATTTYGPTDHSEETGSAGFETDASNSFIDCHTLYNALNGLSPAEFGVVTVFEVLATDSARRIWSAESLTSGDSPWTRFSGTPTIQTNWSGTSSIFVQSNPVPAEELHSFLQTFDASTIRTFSDGSAFATDTYSDLNDGQPTFVRLGATADGPSSEIKAKFGFFALLDFTAVTAVDASWGLGLSQAINAVTSFDPHEIAAAINTYDSDITGYYYALNELSSGDASDYYLLAYNIQDQTAITQGVYGLTSPSGVTGTVLVPVPVTGGGLRGRYQGLYRARYNGVGRY
jgi:hypothetical protein